MASSIDSPVVPSDRDISDENVIPSNSETTLHGAIEVEFPSIANLNSDTEVKERSFAFDTKFVKRFYLIHKQLFGSGFYGSTVTGLFILLVLLVVLQEYVVYHVGLIASGYYEALGNKDIDLFWRQTLKSFGLICAVTFINATTQYWARILSATKRQVLCEAIHRVYFADIRYYQLNILDKEIDNPDQRMTQDIDKFCTTYCEVLPKLLVSPFTIAYYCYQGYQRSGWQGPVGCFGFFLVATIINKLLMGPIVTYVVKQEKREGDFRFLHMLVRVHSESIAFHEAGILEHEKLNGALTSLVDTQRSLYNRQYFLSLAVNFFDYIGSIFSYFMLAIPIFSGEYDDLTPIDLSILISQNAFVLIYLIFSFTRLIDLSDKFADVVGVTHRIAQLLERLKKLEDYWKSFSSPSNQTARNSVLNLWAELRNQISQKISQENVDSDNTDSTSNSSSSPQQTLPIWTLENVTLTRPDSDVPLISSLNYQFIVGESVIITGASAAGKTSLFRALRGLWRHSGSNIKSHFPPGPQGVYFCPQRAYLTWGSLREQISFPLKPDKSKANDKLILHYIDKLKLSPILERVGGLDKPCSWTVFDSLSPGEMQRLCILRIFFHQPVVAVLDEVTSALPLDMEKFVYGEFKRVGITLISVGHRESIRKYHDKQLVIHAKGTWEVLPIEL